LLFLRCHHAEREVEAARKGRNDSTAGLVLENLLRSFRRTGALRELDEVEVFAAVKAVGKEIPLVAERIALVEPFSAAARRSRAAPCGSPSTKPRRPEG